jgi:hypothetical protein
MNEKNIVDQMGDVDVVKQNSTTTFKSKLDNTLSPM